MTHCSASPLSRGTLGAATDTPPSSAGPSLRSLVLAAATFTLWMAVLITLVVRTANPVTLNRRQILESRLVVEANVLETASARCEVRRTWPAGQDLDVILVPQISRLEVDSAESYLMPLIPSADGTYEIVPVERGKRNADPRIYPATAAAIEQLEAILASE